MRPGLIAAVLLTVAAAGADEPPVGWSVGVGLVTAIVPLAVSGGVLATNEDVGPRHAAMHAMTMGWALAPIVSHLIAREWTRAAIFGAVPMAAAAVAIGILEGSRPDDLLGAGNAAPRVAYGAALAVELLAAGVGLVDSMMAGERARRKLAVAPTLSPTQWGLSLGGRW